MWGWKPYDKSINPVENLFVSLGAHGEGMYFHFNLEKFDSIFN
jgi:hypothetical protein